MLCATNFWKNGGTAVISLQKGDPCTIILVDNGSAVTSDKLHGFRYELSVFDIIVELLHNSPRGKARKGNSRGPDDKVGYGRCTADTVVGAIAIHYFGKKTDESCFDPVFVFSCRFRMGWYCPKRKGICPVDLAIYTVFADYIVEQIQQDNQ